MENVSHYTYFTLIFIYYDNISFLAHTISKRL